MVVYEDNIHILGSIFGIYNYELTSIYTGYENTFDQNHLLRTLDVFNLNGEYKNEEDYICDFIYINNVYENIGRILTDNNDKNVVREIISKILQKFDIFRKIMKRYNILYKYDYIEDLLKTIITQCENELTGNQNQ